MLRSRLICRLAFSRGITASTASATQERSSRTVDDIAEDLLNSPKSRVPQQLSRIAAAIRMRFGKDNVDPAYKSLLDKAATQLYYSCANNYNYEKLCDSFGLGDYMSSWYKLTLLHAWMILMRVHVSLDGDAYLRLQRSLLSTMWFDVDQRLQIVSKEIKQVVTGQSDMKHMHGLHIQTFLEYDEGFLHDDRVLAGAIWRCLYLQREFDPVRVQRVVAYMRSTVAWLDTLDLNDILVDGVKEWKQIRPKHTISEERREAVNE